MAHISQKCDHLEYNLNHATDVFDTAIIETKNQIKNHVENQVSQAMIQIQDTILSEIKKEVMQRFETTYKLQIENSAHTKQ